MCTGCCIIRCADGSAIRSRTCRPRLHYRRTAQIDGRFEYIAGKAAQTSIESSLSVCISVIQSPFFVSSCRAGTSRGQCVHQRRGGVRLPANDITSGRDAELRLLAAVEHEGSVIGRNRLLTKSTRTESISNTTRTYLFARCAQWKLLRLRVKLFICNVSLTILWITKQSQKHCK